MTNYRPITILTVLAKHFDKLQLKEIRALINKVNLIIITGSPRLRAPHPISSRTGFRVFFFLWPGFGSHPKFHAYWPRLERK